VDARSSAMHRLALEQLDGGLSRRLMALREELIGVEALIAYDVDFPEEDDGPIPRERIAEAVSALLASLDALLATAPAGQLVRVGAVVAIAGEPNVGKSSLFNALLGESRAIVTEIPGTTRDAIEAVLDAGGWTLRLVDTAGLRETGDRVEKIGIEVSERYLQRAEVVLACGDSDESLARVTEWIGARSSAPVLPVRTKSDIAPTTESFGAATATADPTGIATSMRETVIVSAELGQGLKELLAAVAGILDREHPRGDPESPIVTRERHVRALTEARNEVAAFQELWSAGEMPAVIAAVHLRAAAGALESLVGAVDIEDVLGRLFASFCVGK
jgi:tRNA modification GTPase